MYRTSSQDSGQMPDSGRLATIKPRRPLCPECHSSLNRVPRRFIDRLVSLVYPVHRYHCRSFACAWEGNLRYIRDLGRWEASESSGATPSRGGYRVREQPRRTPANDPEADATLPRESDTLPMPQAQSQKTKTPNASVDPRDATSASRRSRRRTKGDFR